MNPGSVVLSGEMMFRYLGWKEVADLILKGLNGAIASKRVTYDFARLMEGRDGNPVFGVWRQHHRTHVTFRECQRLPNRLDAADAVAAADHVGGADGVWRSSRSAGWRCRRW